MLKIYLHNGRIQEIQNIILVGDMIQFCNIMEYLSCGANFFEQLKPEKQSTLEPADIYVLRSI